MTSGGLRRLSGRIRSIATGNSDHRLVARGAGVAFVLQGAGAGLVFGMQVLLGRWLGARGYGSYSFTVAWAGLLSVAIGLGLPATVLRFVPAFISHEDWPRLRGILRFSLSLTVAVGFGLSALATGVVVLLRGGGADVGWAVILGLWLAPLLALRTLQQETVRGFRRVVLAYGPTFLVRPSLVILGAAVYVALGNSLTSVVALSITAIAFVVLNLGQQA